MEKVHNDIVLDGHPDIIQARRTAIKLAQRPKIIVAMPVGGKPIIDVFEDKDGNKYANQRGFHAQGLIPVQFMLSHMNWTPPLNVSMSYMVKTNMLSSHARQIMTMEAIRQGAEYIFYVDDDTLIPPLGLYTLYNFMEQNPHAGAVSGVYTTRETPNEPLIYKEHGEGCSWDFEMGKGATPELIFGAGAGCLLARVSHIKKWMEDNPGLPIWADEKDIPSTGEGGNAVMWGHDVRFCRLLNLQGTPVYVHGGVLCGHYDIKSGQTFTVPDTAPGFQKLRNRVQNINTAPYWDQVYGREGADTWRKYPEMFQKIYDEVQKGRYSGDELDIIELGCGVGILGSKLLAAGGCYWKGYDISPTAVDMCKARFLDAEVLDLRNLDPNTHLYRANLPTIIMSETLEHLERPVGVEVLGKIRQSSPGKLILTTPNNCMGPEDVPEHTALFNREHVVDMLMDAGFSTDQWDISFEEADAYHLMTVVERK